MSTSTPRLEALLAVMKRLRDPETGCPWDIGQTFATIAPYTIEEAYEVAQAIADEDWTGLKEELGDLLLQVVFHAQIAQDRGLFDFEEVAGAIEAKMVERHPHVFGETRFADANAQREAWEAGKAQARAKKHASLLDDVPLALPALARALKLGRRSARAGFDLPDLRGVRAKLDEELAELNQAMTDGAVAEIEEELGDVLFTLAQLARHAECDAEEVLRRANAKFERRFRCMETLARAEGHTVSASGPEALEEYWNRVKRQESPDVEGRHDVSSPTRKPPAS